MRQYLLNVFPWLTPVWYFIRASLAAFGGLCLYMVMFMNGIALEVIKSGLFVVSISATLVAEALLLGFTFKLFIKTLGSGVVAKENPVVESGDFDIKDNGEVIYDSGTTLADLKKAKFTADTWKSLAKKYQGKDYRGSGWQSVRLYCLEQAKKAPSFEVNGNVIQF